jgi:hypothetical protein
MNQNNLLRFCSVSIIGAMQKRRDWTVMRLQMAQKLARGKSCWDRRKAGRPIFY